MRLLNTIMVTAITLAAATTVARAEFGHVGFDTGFHTQSAFTELALVLDAGLRPTNDLELGLTMPFAAGSVDNTGVSSLISSGSDSGAAVGNVMLGATYVEGDSAATHSRLGLHIGIPLAKADDSLGDVQVLSLAAATYGMRNVWWYTTDFVPVVLSVELETAGGPLFLLADTAIGVLFPVRDRADYGGGVDAALQLRAGAAYGSELVHAGVKLGFVNFIADGSSDDATQIALEPFVRMSELGPLYGEASLTINLDKPLGFAFDDGQVWGLHLGLGARL